MSGKGSPLHASRTSFCFIFESRPFKMALPYRKHVNFLLYLTLGRANKFVCASTYCSIYFQFLKGEIFPRARRKDASDRYIMQFQITRENVSKAERVSNIVALA